MVRPPMPRWATQWDSGRLRHFGNASLILEQREFLGTFATFVSMKSAYGLERRHPIVC